MFLYHLHDLQNAVIAPWRYAAEAAQATLHNPLMAISYTDFGRAMAAGAEIFERSTRPYSRPSFNLNSVQIRGVSIKVEQETAVKKPFCQLIHFKRSCDIPALTERMSHDPRVLIVAPLAGNFATLLRGTVEAMLPEHDVYITDWADAKMVPLASGNFDLDDNISYIMDFIRLLGPDVHVMAVCQPSVPVLAAVSLLAEDDEPSQPRSMTLMGGPVDASAAKTLLTEFVVSRSLDWFRNTVIQSVPFYYPGAYRMVYPGFLQLQGFMSMHMDRHVGEQFKMFSHLVRGDDEAASNTRKFYDEYLAVMDVTSEFYLQTIERVFQKRCLPNGTFTWKDRLVRPEAIRKTALLVVEGEMDDISAPGQTRAALDICKNLSPPMKQAYMQIGVGHFGVFNGRRWRTSIQPVVRDFIRSHNRNA